MKPEIVRVPAKPCPECKHPLNAIGSIQDGDRGPQPGDSIACLRCGAVMTLGADGALRGFTEPEMAELMADTEGMDELARMVKRIHLLKHAQN